jgi:Family of unknown function (DUF6152)
VRKSFAWVGMAMLVLLCSRGSQAHHSFAMFDQARQVTLKGVVSGFQWANPHAFLMLDVTAAKDSGTWQVELNSPNNLKRQGWKSTTFKPGDHVSVVICPLRDGSKGGLFVSAVLADGTALGDATRGNGPTNVPSVN